MPRHWWPSLDAMSAIIESAGPWPSPSPTSNGTFLPLDVDKYDGLAIVVGYGEDRHGREALGTDEFQEMETGKWNRLGGGSSGHRLHLREDDLNDARQALHLRMSGTYEESQFDDRRALSLAVFVCGSEVATVKVDRLLGTRTADVSLGPGWLAALWTPTDPASIRAYTGEGELSFSWAPPGEAA